MLSIEPQTAAWVPSLFLFVFLLEWKQCQKLYLGKCFARISPLVSNIQGEDYCAFTIKDRVMKRGLRLEDSVEPAVALFAAWAWAWTGTFVSNLLGDGVVPEKSLIRITSTRTHESEGSGFESRCWQNIFWVKSLLQCNGIIIVLWNLCINHVRDMHCIKCIVSISGRFTLNLN